MTVSSCRNCSYLLILTVGVILDRFLAYRFGAEPLLLGQPASVIWTYTYFAIAVVFWLGAQGRQPTNLILMSFLALMATAWFIHFALYRLHGDAFNYSALLSVPVLAMLLFKPPDSMDVRRSVLGAGWTIALILTATRLLEMVGLMQVRNQDPNIVSFDEQRYFLPLNEILGIDGRWPGPFGHNGDTAMMGALLIVIAVAFWSRASWVFLGVGALTLVLTNGRASIGAAAVGLVIVFMFTSSERVDRIPRKWRVTSGLVVLALGAVLMFLRPSGLTGRDNIWPAFLDLWRESPWIGVGGSGFVNGNEITRQFGHAHSLYIEELARSGLVGFISLSIALGIGIWIAAKATGLGYPGPLAVMATFFVTGITEPRNNWIEPSATGFLLILMVLAASAKLQEQRREITAQPLQS